MCSRMPGSAASRAQPAWIFQGCRRRGLCRHRSSSRPRRQEEAKEGRAGRRNQGAGGAELLQGRGRSHPHHVAGLPDLLRRAGHRAAEAVRLQEGRLQPELVEDHRARRHPSRCADPFLGRRRHRGHDRRRRTGGAARRHRRAQAGGEGSRLSHGHRGRADLGEAVQEAAEQLLRRHAVGLGRRASATPPSSPARTPAAPSTSPALRPSSPNGC